MAGPGRGKDSRLNLHSPRFPVFLKKKRGGATLPENVSLLDPS